MITIENQPSREELLMDFEFWPAFVAGVLGGATMSALIAMMRAAGKTGMNIELIEGTMLTGKKQAATGLGLTMHLVVLSGLVIGSLYAWVFTLIDPPPTSLWWIGGLLGVVHGVLGGMAMAMVPTMHPRMVREPALAGGPAVDPVASEEPRLQLRPPGLFGRNYGAMTPVGIIVTHVAYGLVVGLVYSWLAA
jgi:hypothetical protein